MTNAARMLCPHCGKEFRRDSELKHIRVYHPDVDLSDRTRPAHALAAPVGSGDGPNRVVACPRPGCTAVVRQCRLSRHLRQAHGEAGTGKGKTSIDTRITTLCAAIQATDDAVRKQAERRKLVALVLRRWKERAA